MGKKKKIIIVFVIILLVILMIILFKGCDNENKPYVEKQGINVSAANEEIIIPFIPYARDKNKMPINPDGVTFKDTKGIYKFYDCKISGKDENGYATYAFKYDLVVPISYTIDRTKNNLDNGWFRSYAFLQANVFDYYTGELYREKNETISGKITYHNIGNPTDKEMQFTNITWNNKTYKIGVRNEISSKWDGNKKVSSNNTIDTYNDTNRITVNVYIYAPYDYDGLMVALNKKGTSKEIVLKQIENNNRYNELVKEYEKSNIKSKELLEFEDDLNKTYKLLDTRYDNYQNTKDDFYVIRVNDIMKGE